MSNSSELIQNLTPEQRQKLIRSLARVILAKEDESNRLQSERSIK